MNKYSILRLTMLVLIASSLIGGIYFTLIKSQRSISLEIFKPKKKTFETIVQKEEINNQTRTIIVEKVVEKVIEKVVEKKAHVCDLNFLIISAPRANTGSTRFAYLERTVKSIVDLQGALLDICVFVFNTDGESVREEITKAANVSEKVTIFTRKHQHNLYTNAFHDAPKKRKQSNDFYDMIKTFNDMPTDGPVILMEDDFVFCPNALSHIVSIFTNVKQKNWSGLRFSFGLNGVIVLKTDLVGILKYMELSRSRSFPVDWLLEELFHKTVPFGKEYFKDRVFYTYRYQLMEHIGVATSVGNYRSAEFNNIDFPHCYESQTQSRLMIPFNMAQCPTSLFYPCEEEPPRTSNDFAHDTKEGEILPPTNTHGITELHNLKAILCEKGENCDTCCSRNNATCDGLFFPYINRCDEMRKHYPDCKCAYELADESRSPNFDGELCVIGNRRSRFRCGNSYRTERRLCPCKPK
ncbi:predicted protein [Naegleria gruberi]|uniref:Predicted protein n=1 Tax=Naegleria gruberi TaxID=5762 RepID=D2VYA4_NAEGR|nr:uncharacterized protein NAEGRDRAFT_74048 [Naegleria gruberi]EFC38166.1 predicted protein [Naegleria gruberi]|eukprot:XP_002670910.1 predicted protein [Naegleria gruberi strain NEG-M]